MPLPPFIGLGLGPAGGGIFPCLLASEGGPVEVDETGDGDLDAALVGEVGPVDFVAVAQEDAEAETLPLVGAQAEVFVEAGAGGGDPRDFPAHALFVGFEIGQRAEGDEHEGGVAGVEMFERADVIDDHRAAGASGSRPAPSPGCEHEVIHEQLPPPLE